MNNKQLIEANKIKKEIDELDDFILHASKVWKGKITFKNIIAKAYGIFQNKEFNMNIEIKNRVLDVLIQYQKELKTELDKI